MFRRERRHARRAAGRLKKLWQATLVAVREVPFVPCAAVGVFLVLLAVGLASVLTASAVSVRNAKDLAERGLGNQVAQSLREAMLIATFGSELLATVVRRQPHCATLDAGWWDISEDIMSKVDPQVVKQLEIDVAGVIWKTSPPLQGETALILYGRDMLREPDDRPGMLYALRERRTLFLGPYNCRDGFKCACKIYVVES
ncbi:hypothetical protein VOLCADRAFT_96601 [Volvox carteri f. nagariensis]|uniref:CHASE domain-containing protein n=1 Tax=Volvox carteri f. nagariensis TaxID=3068 RepID=D8UAJ4_VOLCA|nr:uncharacterized protein VOLCADRAFT_96601 [Volvox carteri f. nagariensis]EFJ43270.1 hypothetical protein VOLCADRAFT_96601 [Volvox carteri f. nagariensis]|eukprot:XP_002955630.1 hypothetical protein VOLCADRAFT_96601 [Volvox carteri f. nagariensis]